jgi:hypothetical protein
MALVKCKECGTEISSKAATCPKCGVTVKRRTGCFTATLAGVLALGGVAVVAGLFVDPEPKSVEAPAEQTPEEKKAAEGVARAALLAKTIREGARNPSSFTLASAIVMESGAACIEYRAQNGFGGMNLEQAVISADGTKAKKTGDSGFNSLWNSQCAGQSGRDVRLQVNQYIDLL